MPQDDENLDMPGFPVRRKGPVGPPEEYKAWAAAGPIKRVRLRSGKTAVAVTRYADSKAILNSTKTSADRLDPRFPNLRQGVFARAADTNLMHMDGEIHQKYRRMLIPEFTPKRLQLLKPKLESFVDESVNRLLRAERPADFHAVFSRPVPSQMICVLLGIDYDKHHQTFEDATQRVLSTKSTPEEFYASMEDVELLMKHIVAEQESDPGDGVIGRLITRYVRTGELSREQLVGFAMLLLVGGHETTATMLTWGAFSLLTEPGLADTLRNDLSLLPGAVEEMFRMHSITDLTVPKLAVEDLEIGGCPVKAGEGILPLGAAANYDERVFANPETFDPRRAEERHLAFGSGIHACLGQNLARLELEIVFRTLLQKVPSLRLAVDVSELRFTHDSIVWALESLPVTWD